MPRKKKLSKRPNGTGTIIKLKGNRRKPFCVRVTIDRDADRRPIRKNLEYFETLQEAQDFLDLYNLMKKKSNRITLSDDQAKQIDNELFNVVKESLDTHRNMLSFADIFNILLEEKYKTETSYKSKISWFKNFKVLHNKRIDSISLFDLQAVIDGLKAKGRKSGTLNHMKCIASDIFEYAVIHEYIKRDQDFTSYIDTSTNVVKETSKRNVFTLEEIQSLITCDTIESKIILIYIFTGCRPIDLFTVDVNNIFIDVPCNDDGTNMIVSYMIVSSKTDAGTNRIVPIHNLIKPYIQELLNMHPTHLLFDGAESKHLGTYYRYNYFNKVIDQLHMQHVPYDTRHTFASLAKLFKVDEFARKRIMGHKSIDLTDDVYTHSYINVLYKEVHKIDIKIS